MAATDAALPQLTGGGLMAVLVAPTEPAALRAVGQVSMVPETMGCDVLVFAGGKKIGVQRKELGDLLASLDDGRLALQVAQMRTAGLDARVLVLEGEVRFTGAADGGGVLAGTWGGRGGRTWTRQQIVSVMWSLAADGITVVGTRGLEDTIGWVLSTEKWWAKGAGDGHRGIRGRGAAPTVWGKARNSEWAAWVLQGFPGIGPELAKRIVEAYGLPLRWTVGVEELAKVKGISKQRAAKWIAALNTKETDG